MFIKQIKIKDFKNVKEAVVYQFNDLYSMISGINGIGKTTIIDAIYWCLTGKLFNASLQG